MKLNYTTGCICDNLSIDDKESYGEHERSDESCECCGDFADTYNLNI